MTTRETLEAARELIRTPETWRQGVFECDGGYCASAALSKIAGCDGSSGVKALIRVIRNLDPNAPQAGVTTGGFCVAVGYVPYFNDTHTHAEVLEIFNLAIADEIAKEKQEAHSRHMAEEQEREAVEDPAAPLVFA